MYYLFKNILLFILFCLVLCETVYSQSWDQYTSPRSRHINQIHCTDSGHVLAIGGSEFNDSIQSIFISSDGCNIWDIIYDNIDPWLTSLDHINNITFAVGFDGTIMKSFDYGASWDYLLIPESVMHRHFRAVDFFDINNGVVVGGNPKNDSIRTIIKTSDGGDSWDVVMDLPDAQLNDVFYINAGKLIAVGDIGKVLQSNDGGETWVISDFAENRNFYSSFFISNNIGFIVGGKPTADSISTILKTTDAGINWELVIDDPGSCLRDIFFIDSHIGYIVGDNMTFYKTTNGGVEWQKEELPEMSDIYDFRSVFFLNESFGYIAGTYGRILKYNPNHLAVNDKNVLTNLKLLNNPVKKFLEIEISPKLLLQDNSTICIEIFGINGSFVKREVIIDENLKIDFSEYPSGVYLYRVTKQNKILKDGKFIKIH